LIYNGAPRNNARQDVTAHLASFTTRPAMSGGERYHGQLLMKEPIQFHFRHKTYLFKFKWGFSLLCLFLFCLCMVLGNWQLHRYSYKKILLTTYQKRLSESPKNFKQLTNSNDLQFQAIKTSGHYINSLTVLLQNRFYHDEIGYEVLTPLQIPNDKKLLLIDRGWIKKPDNQELPDIRAITKAQEIQGHIKLLNEYQFILGKNILQPNQTPLIAQRLDVNELSRITHQTFYPFIVRLNANPKEENNFIRDWTIVTVLPARHMAYAVQWFLLALVLFIAYFCFCCEEKKNTYAKNI
jgi:surfeit locus 1 family protein